LLWTLVHRPVEGLAAVAQLDGDDLAGLASAGVLTLAASLGDVPPDFVPALLRERLNETERAMVDRAAAAAMPPAGPVECVQAIKRMRIERDIAAVQEEIDRLQTVPGGSDDRLAELWTKKKVLLTQL
jgi:hypothetical protein